MHNDSSTLALPSSPIIIDGNYTVLTLRNLRICSNKFENRLNIRPFVFNIGLLTVLSNLLLVHNIFNVFFASKQVQRPMLQVLYHH